MSEPAEYFETTELPCERCGVPVFQRTARRKRYCSHRCMNNAWRERHGYSMSGRNQFSVTVTYTDATGAKLTTVGHGRSKRSARKDADAKVPRSFVAVDAYASTPQTILTSLRKTAA